MTGSLTAHSLIEAMAERLEKNALLLRANHGTKHALRSEALATQAREWLKGGNGGEESQTVEAAAKLIYQESHYAFGFDSFPPSWEELEETSSSSAAGTLPERF